MIIMSNKKNRNKNSYTPVECQSLVDEKPIPENTISYIVNPYTIIGSCKKSKSGNVLSCLIEIEGKAYYLTILKKHIDALWSGECQIAHIRLYDNSNTNKED